MQFVLKLIIYFLFLQSSVDALDLSFLTKYFTNYNSDNNHENSDINIVGSNNGRKLCDENKLMLHLAKLYIISPERILLLLTGDSNSEICNGIQRTMNKIKIDFKFCTPLSSDNLYMRLLESTKIFYNDVCENNDKSKEFIRYHQCLRELREEFIDCEGPADWFEKTNKTLLCQIFIDVLNCDYIKTAELCGLQSAFTVRSLSLDIFRPILPVKCYIPRSLPNIKDPMPLTDDSKARTFSIRNKFCLIFVISIIYLT